MHTIIALDARKGVFSSLIVPVSFQDLRPAANTTEGSYPDRKPDRFPGLLAYVEVKESSRSTALKSKCQREKLPHDFLLQCYSVTKTFTTNGD